MLLIADILAFLDAEGIEYAFSGSMEETVDGFSSLGSYRPGSFTWIKTQKNIPEGMDLRKIKLAFVSGEVEGEFTNAIRTDRSKQAFFSTIEHFFEKTEDKPAIGQFTYLSPDVKLGKNVRIGHNCTLDGDIAIGDNTVIWNNVVIVNRVKIGRDCEIQSGSVIGHDCFSYTEDENHEKTMIKHYGGVTIGDRVFMNENVLIGRGSIDDTIIGDGVKLSAMVRISHNCVIGKNAAIPLACILCGSVHVGENAYIAGDVIRNQCSIGKDAVVGLGAVVVKNVPDGETVVGNPAKPFVKKG